MGNRKKLAGSIIIILLFLSVGVVIWLGGKKDQDIKQKQPAVSTPAPIYTPYPQAQTVGDPIYSLRLQGPPESPVYIFRLFTVGGLAELNGQSQGQGYFPWDDKKKVIVYNLEAKNGNYFVGVCTAGGLCEYANRIDTVTFPGLSALVPHGSLIQLKVNTEKLPAQDKAAIQKAFDAGLQTTWNFNDIILHPFEIDIIQK